MIREVLAPESWLRRNAQWLAVASGLSLGLVVGSVALEIHRQEARRQRSISPTPPLSGLPGNALTVQGSATLGDSLHRAPEGFAADNGFAVDLPSLASDEVLAWDGSKWTAQKVEPLTLEGTLPRLTVDAPETDVTFTIATREYARIQIPADYHCAKAQSGWECVRGGR